MTTALRTLRVSCESVGSVELRNVLCPGPSLFRCVVIVNIANRLLVSPEEIDGSVFDSVSHLRRCPVPPVMWADIVWITFSVEEPLILGNGSQPIPVCR